MRTYDHDKTITAMQRLESAVLSLLQQRHYGRESDPHFADAIDHAEDEMALAARDLNGAVEGLPVQDRPVGWARKFALPRAEWEPIADTLRAAEVDATPVPARYMEAFLLIARLVDAPEMSEYERIRRIKLVLVAFGHVNAAVEAVSS